MNTAADFNEHYFKGGSNYTDYTKKKFDGLCEDLITVCRMNTTDKILDFGCASGGLLAEFKKRGFTKLTGTDISDWALTFGKQEYGLQSILKPFSLGLLNKKYDWVLMLDVAEHVNTIDLFGLLHALHKCDIKKGIIIRIPVSANEGEDFVLDVSKNDKTHIQRHEKKWWEAMFNIAGYKTYIAITMPTIYDSEGVMVRQMVKI
mgnify:CR=1 FL=1